MSSVTSVFATNVDAGGTDLRWDRYVPISGGPTWPAAVIVHGGYYESGNRGPVTVAQDLANAGFITFAPEYRLAPPHAEMDEPIMPGDGQVDPPSDGRPPEQTDDVRLAIRTARADTQCNGKVVVLGFSTGAAHALWYCLIGTANDDKPDAFVGCSGPYDLDNSDILTGLPLNKIENYIDHTLGEGAAFHTAARAASPYWLTIIGTPCPCLLFNSDDEQIPSSVYTNEVTQLTNAGGTIESHLRSGHEHSSAYWNLGYGGAFATVKACSIDFLGRALTITPTAVAPAKIVLQRK